MAQESMGTLETSTMLVLASVFCSRCWNFEALIVDLPTCDVQAGKSFNINTFPLFMESARVWRSHECQQTLVRDPGGLFFLVQHENSGNAGCIPFPGPFRSLPFTGLHANHQLLA